MMSAAIFGILSAVLRLPAVGAPIRFISVGADFKLEASVDGIARSFVGHVETLPSGTQMKLHTDLKRT